MTTKILNLIGNFGDFGGTLGTMMQFLKVAKDHL